MRLERIPALNSLFIFVFATGPHQRRCFILDFQSSLFLSLEVINQELSESFLAVMVRLLNCFKSLHSNIKLPRKQFGYFYNKSWKTSAFGKT